MNTVDKYSGCPLDIVNKLRHGFYVMGYAWFGDIRKSRKITLVNYSSAKGCPFESADGDKFTHFSTMDPNELNGSYGIFWNDNQTGFITGKLLNDPKINNSSKIFSNGDDYYKYFSPCEITPTDINDLPKNQFIFTKENI